jgi:2-iminobutanoate/2-iminopropanoate deaminase
MTRTIVSSEAAPRAIGPYSQAIRQTVGTSQMLFLSGQIPLHPETMVIVGENASEQTERVMLNIEAVLAAGGATFGNVVKTTIFLLDMGDFAAVNEVYAKRFEGLEPPARSTIQVARLPRDARVEIEMVAVIP